jgi:ferredoxin
MLSVRAHRPTPPRLTRSGPPRPQRRTLTVAAAAAESSKSGITLSERARALNDAAARAPAFPQPGESGYEYAPDDYYTLLELTPSASASDVRDAYRRLQKACHPDVAGDEATECSVLLNEAAATLSDPALRRAYDLGLAAARMFAGADGADGGGGDASFRPFTGQSFSEWRGQDPRAADAAESRAVFVDEGTCIGCKNCTHCAGATFAMEPDWGRARVFAQWADSERDIQTAIDSCPVDCIHWVGKRTLPVLEFVMQRAKRVGVASAVGGGVRAGDPFELAGVFLRKGREREAAAAAGGGFGGADAGGAAAAGALQGRVRAAWRRLRREVRMQWRGYAAEQEER